ncbi:Respiratory-chain NADH dehydrogenase domain, 51 kDa subunit [Rubrobacter xylanophilus DSM 9941]|uniref:Respiratory-chain NADH dehydrogenase domain, 51 kDa subunit n=1 Tax=Rubrobacter xylanophilus (strain DSM 9941 / JCM 11954 / NBRC 16129 / PRD-1) TaxID=266117 RepID=Q1AWR7_RUBXD|nr:NADH dehydrogenase [Rubrobacter xylanophilus]ABG04161.1 Respiratory-chain NADH dehydrogenase domain, 51 kDa subunit [Rubrobacter xylanophilus DSM 9941]
MVEMRERSLEEVKALSREEAVDIMQHAGIVGAGGGGFPTYFKYKRPLPHLIVNATESEPGYWGDKLLHKIYLKEFLQLFEAMKAIFEFEQISLGVHEKDREWYAEYEDYVDEGIYDIRYVPDTYALGEEKTLVKHATDKKVPLFTNNPDGTRRPGMPPDVGIVVNNSETLLNVYRALFLGKPLTTVFFTVFGMEKHIMDLKAYEAPVGTPVREILEISGLDLERQIAGASNVVGEDGGAERYVVADGGPYINDILDSRDIMSGEACIRRTTNSLLLIPEGRQTKEYARDIKTKPPKDGFVSLVGKVSEVRVPLAGGPLTPGTPLVSEGDEVAYEQKIAEPAERGFSIGVWASLEGRVTSVGGGVISISGTARDEERERRPAELQEQYA